MIQDINTLLNSVSNIAFRLDSLDLTQITDYSLFLLVDAV